MLTADDPLPRPPRRVLVAGVTGSGKTTLSRRIAATWDLRHVEIDGLFHGENWTPRPSFLDDVRAFAAEERWVTEWQYGEVRDLLAERAELLIWLDLPRGTVTRQVVSRTLRRRLLRQELWNGNTEGPLRTFFTKQKLRATFVAKVGPAADVIAELADKGKFDLLMMGSHGHGTLGNLVLGSVTNKVMAHCSTPVLIVR